MALQLAQIETLAAQVFQLWSKSETRPNSKIAFRFFCLPFANEIEMTEFSYAFLSRHICIFNTKFRYLRDSKWLFEMLYYRVRHNEWQYATVLHYISLYWRTVVHCHSLWRGLYYSTLENKESEKVHHQVFVS